MALQDTLPADWGTKSAAEKVEFFNTAGVTPSQLAAAGVPASDINWMQTVGGYKVPDVAPATTQIGAGNAWSIPDAVDVPAGEDRKLWPPLPCS